MRWPFGKSTPSVDVELVATRAAEAVIERQMSLAPIQPLGKPDMVKARPNYPYALDYPYNFWLTWNPKKLPGKNFHVDTLRMWADTFDPLRSIIEYLKGEVASIPIKIVGLDGHDAKDTEEIDKWLQDDGPLGGVGFTRRAFEAKMLEDVLVTGQSAVWYERGRGGKILSCDCIDAGTIKPAVDALGWLRKTQPYEQWVMGVPVGAFEREDLRLDGLTPRTHTPYFTSPVEWAVRVIFNGEKVDEWNTSWLTDGNVSTGDTIALGGEMDDVKVQEFAAWWEAHKSNAGTRQRTKFLPPGSQVLADHSRKDQDFQEFELQVIRRLCALFGVQAASIGYVGEQYKVSQAGSFDHSRRVGVGRLLRFRKEFYDDLLRRLGRPDLQVVDVDDDLEQRAGEAAINIQECGSPYMTINEVRARQGLKPMQGGDEIAGLQDESDDLDIDDDEEEDDEDRAFNPRQPRGKNGKWIPTAKLAKIIAKRHNASGGLTYGLFDGNMSGLPFWSVGSRLGGLQVSGSKVTEEEVRGFIEAYITEFRSGYYIGLWYDEDADKTYFDIAELIPEAKFKTAFRLGEKRNEVGIYNLRTKEFVSTGGDGS